MQLIHDLVTRFRNKDFASRYPEFDMNDGKVHVLYFLVHANGIGLYRFMLPYLHLNETATHSAIIANMVDYEGLDKQNQQSAMPHDDLLKWAHYIVLPTITSDFRPIFLEMLKVNPKLVFCMDIDDNLHKLDESHPMYHKTTKDMKWNLIRNMSLCSFITAPNLKLLEFYRDKVKDATTKDIEIATVYNLLSPHIFEKNYLEKQPPPQFNKIRIGMIVNEVHFPNVYAFRKILKEVKDKYGGSIELINIGWNGKTRMKDTFAGLNMTIVPGKPIADYFNAIRDQCFDFAIIPLRNEPEFNQYKAFQRWLEYAAFKVPVIVGDSEVYTGIVQHEKTGLVSNSRFQWMTNIEKMIERSAEERKVIGEAAYVYAWTNLSWNAQAIELLCETFFKP